MAFCGKCGSKIEDGVKFCPACGAPTESAAATQQPSVQQPAQNQQAYQQQPGAAQQPGVNPQAAYNAKIQALTNTADSTAQFDAADIQQSKVMCILAYFGPLVLIPIFAAKGSRFARYHSNQGLLLLIAEIIWSIVYSILSSIILAISWRLYSIVSIIGIVSIVFLVLAVIGILNVVNGRARALPVIGGITILK